MLVRRLFKKLLKLQSLREKPRKLKKTNQLSHKVNQLTPFKMPQTQRLMSKNQNQHLLQSQIDISQTIPTSNSLNTQNSLLFIRGSVRKLSPNMQMQIEYTKHLRLPIRRHRVIGAKISHVIIAEPVLIMDSYSYTIHQMN